MNMDPKHCSFLSHLENNLNIFRNFSDVRKKFLISLEVFLMFGSLFTLV